MTVTNEQLTEAWESSRELPPRQDIYHLEPGIHFDIPFEDYCRIDAINKSSLYKAMTSLAHYRYAPAMDETPTFRMGSLIHCGKLEPDELASRYVVIPDRLVEEVQQEARLYPPDKKVADRVASGQDPYLNVRATGAYKAKLREFLLLHPGKQEVSQDWFDNMAGMLRSMVENPRAYKLFDSGWPEVVLVWIDPETGERCKARIDWLCENADQADAKSAADVVRWSVEDYAYHIQAASYLEGYVHAYDQMSPSQRRKFPKSLNPYHKTGAKRRPRPRQFHFVVIEKTRPWTCLCAPCSDRVIVDGTNDYHFLLRKISAARNARQTGADMPAAWPQMRSPDSWDFSRWYRSADYPLARDNPTLHPANQYVIPNQSAPSPSHQPPTH